MKLRNEDELAELRKDIEFKKSGIEGMLKEETKEEIGRYYELVQYQLQELEDELMIEEALLSINIEHCKRVGIDIAELLGAINRITKR